MLESRHKKEFLKPMVQRAEINLNLLIFYTLSSLPAGAVDGNRTAGLFHTQLGGVPAPWIMLDFGGPFKVYQILVFTRNDYTDLRRFINVAVSEDRTDLGVGSLGEAAWSMKAGDL